MPNSSRLVPTPVTDRNGVQTTRWKKPAPAGRTPAVLPAVTVPSGRVREETVLRHLLEGFQLVGASMTSGGTATGGTMEEALRSFGDDTVRLVEEYTRTNNFASAANWISLYVGQEAYLRELFTFHDVFDVMTEHYFVEDAIARLHAYQSLPPMEDYSRADPELKAMIVNLLGVTETLLSEAYEDGECYDASLPEDLFRLVVERPQDADRINALILANPGLNSGERIAMMLDSPSASLASGIL